MPTPSPLLLYRCVSREGLFCLPAISSTCLPPPKHLSPGVLSGPALSSHGVYSYSRSSLFRVMAWAARARGPCCVKWYPKRTMDGHCSSTVAISISTASPGHWRWRTDGGMKAIRNVWQAVHHPGLWTSGKLRGLKRVLIWLPSARQ